MQNKNSIFNTWASSLQIPIWFNFNNHLLILIQYIHRFIYIYNFLKLLFTGISSSCDISVSCSYRRMEGNNYFNNETSGVASSCTKLKKTNTIHILLMHTPLIQRAVFPNSQSNAVARWPSGLRPLDDQIFWMSVEKRCLNKIILRFVLPLQHRLSTSKSNYSSDAS